MRYTIYSFLFILAYFARLHFSECRGLRTQRTSHFAVISPLHLWQRRSIAGG
nr:MAG TPA: hypothetical protein [Caudoviricetes sp.]DAP03019.1 MAG TPA: hypothetical protein [Caudoviricetes sp.]DAV94186.1 MAG TPA: hypothetical protein [Caudoviricetes sp.]